MTHFDNGAPISNQAVNQYFQGSAYMSVYMKNESAAFH
jgi:hypothetical protein